MEEITVRSSAGSYAVLCGRGLAREVVHLTERAGPHTGLFLVSSPTVWKNCGAQLGRLLDRASCPPILFADGETAKNLRTVEQLCRKLVRSGADRQSVLVAVGGGVVGDVAGFAAACYLRGVRLVHVPTTVVAQSDSAIGGKTGVNLPEGKNLVGAFYPPRLVVVDPNLLRTLPQRQYRAGLYEVVKYGVLADAELFSFLKQRMEDLLRRDGAALDWVVPRCIRVKADIVSRDERETGLREILNFGHTIGHALEAVTAYKRFLHGEAVGWGMLAATQIAVESKLLDPGEAARITGLLKRVGTLPRVEKATAVFVRRLLAATRSDKKARGGCLRWVLPRRIGHLQVISEVSESVVRNGIALALSGRHPAHE